MTRPSGTDVWHKTVRLRRATRIAYAISPNDRAEDRWATERLDPLNPRRTPDDPTYPFASSSVLDMPGAPDEQWARRTPVRRGLIQERTITSAVLSSPKFGSERPVWIYTPPGYNPNAGPYPVVSNNRIAPRRCSSRRRDVQPPARRPPHGSAAAGISVWVWPTALAIALLETETSEHPLFREGPLSGRVTVGRGEPQRYGVPAAALCGGSVVILQQSTQPLTTRNRAVVAGCPLGGEEQSVAHALVVAFVMIVLDEFVNRVTE